MFRHVVMMKWTEESTPEQRSAAIEAVRGLSAVVPTVRALSCGTDAGVAEGNFDFVAVVDFDDVAGYQAYASHPDHVQVITELLRPIAAQRAAVQYELEG
ncbi:MAG: Dabb family protein [Acidimicrobiales bacterium]